MFDAQLRQLGAAYEEYGLITPKEKWVEQEVRLVAVGAQDQKCAALGAAMLAARAVGQELPLLEYTNTYVPKRDYEEKYKAFRAVEYRLWEEEKA